MCAEEHTGVYGLPTLASGLGRAPGNRYPASSAFTNK